MLREEDECDRDYQLVVGETRIMDGFERRKTSEEHVLMLLVLAV